MGLLSGLKLISKLAAQQVTATASLAPAWNHYHKFCDAMKNRNYSLRQGYVDQAKVYHNEALEQLAQCHENRKSLIICGGIGPWPEYWDKLPPISYFTFPEVKS